MPNSSGDMSARSTSPTAATPIQMQHDKELASADATRVATADPALRHSALETPAKLHLFVDIDRKDLGFTELTSGHVGHTWISLEYNDPTKVPATVHPAHKPLLEKGGKYSDPMGFWPKTGYSINPLWPWVEGLMRHPDRAHEGAEKATETWDIRQPALDKVIDYAEWMRDQSYSVYHYNCTTFAMDAVKEAGVSPPNMTSALGFTMPNAAYEGIKTRQKAGIGKTSVKDFDTLKETVVSGPDETPKKR